MKKVRKYIKPHKRKGTKKLVTGHKRTYHKKKQPKPSTTHTILQAFLQNPRPLTASEISKHWKLHPHTTQKYIDILKRKGRIRKQTINGKTYWELK